MKPLDSNDGAAEDLTSEDGRSILAARIAPVGGALADDVEPVTPRAYSEIVPAAYPEGVVPAGPSRVSRVVPRGTAEEEAGALEPADLDAVRLEAEAQHAAEDAIELAAGELAAGELAAGELAAGEPAGPEPEAPEQGEAQPPAEVSEASAQPEPEQAAHAVGAVNAGEVPAGVRESGLAPSTDVVVGACVVLPSAVLPSAVLPSAEGLDLSSTLLGFGPDDEDEATTVDAGAALSDEERVAMRRGHAALDETVPVVTPVPPVTASAVAWDRNNSPFKQTMFGLPVAPASVPSTSALSTSALSTSALSTSAPGEAQELAAPPAAVSAAAPNTDASGEPAVMASLVRVVGPPTQPPPRRSRRAGSLAPQDGSEQDHEAFVLTNPITAPHRVTQPPSAPSNGAPSLNFGTLVGRSSFPGVMLPPPPQPRDFEPASSPEAAAPPPGLATPGVPPGAFAAPYPPLPGSAVSAPLAPSQRPKAPPSEFTAPALSALGVSSTVPGGAGSAPLRATLEASQSLSRTRPPQARHAAERPLAELPTADPFAGFVAPAPSLAQRWLVVVVVALAVVGLCSLAAIAFGFLGKTGW